MVTYGLGIDHSQSAKSVSHIINNNICKQVYNTTFSVINCSSVQ